MIECLAAGAHHVLMLSPLTHTLILACGIACAAADLTSPSAQSPAKPITQPTTQRPPVQPLTPVPDSTEPSAERVYPPGYPDEAKPKDPRRPGVSGGPPKNPPPIRDAGECGSRWPVTIGTETYAVEVFATGLPHVMNIAFLPSGEMIIAERRGTVRLIQDGAPVDPPIYEVAYIFFKGDCGLMSMCLHPDFLNNSLVFLYYGDKANQDGRIVRLRLDATGD